MYQSNFSLLCIKHVAIDFHFVHDKVFVGQHCASHVSTQDQLVEALTKSLFHQWLLLFLSKMGVSNGIIILRWNIGNESTTSPNLVDSSSWSTHSHEMKSLNFNCSQLFAIKHIAIFSFVTIPFIWILILCVYILL